MEYFVGTDEEWLDAMAIQDAEGEAYCAFSDFEVALAMNCAIDDGNFEELDAAGAFDD